MTTLLEEARLALRLKTEAFDDGEIRLLIDACILDLEMHGVVAESGNPLFRQAVRLYVKGEFGYGDEQERFRSAYRALRDSMALSGDYKVGGGVDVR